MFFYDSERWRPLSPPPSLPPEKRAMFGKPNEAPEVTGAE